MRTVPLKGATNVRSIANIRIGHDASAWSKYFRLGNLAFERERRDLDIRAAMERAGDSERRVAEIEAEEALLLASIEAAKTGSPLPANIPRRTEASRRRGSAGFVLRY
ncbi:MAG: hypothetical protein H8E44_33580 [Planctomycetes bacterium]|nr:hypothetical protein [Planctomycetota bacterium]